MWQPLHLRQERAGPKLSSLCLTALQPVALGHNICERQQHVHSSSKDMVVLKYGCIENGDLACDVVQGGVVSLMPGEVHLASCQMNHSGRTA